jgi:hypothetical protein
VIQKSWSILQNGFAKVNECWISYGCHCCVTYSIRFNFPPFHFKTLFPTFHGSLIKLKQKKWRIHKNWSILLEHSVFEVASSKKSSVENYVLIIKLTNYIFNTLSVYEPVTVAEWSKAWTVLARLDAGIIGSNPTRGMDVYVYVYSVFVLSCAGRGLAMSWSLVQGVLPTVLDKETAMKRECSWMSHAPVGAKKKKYIYIYGSTVLLLDFGRYFNFLILCITGRTPCTGMSPSQGRYLHTEQHKHRIDAKRHPCFEWSSNQRPQHLRKRRQFMP